MKRLSLTKKVLGSRWIADGVIANADGSLSRAFEVQLLSSGFLEEALEGPATESFYSKLSDLITRLPNLFEGQLLICRRRAAPADLLGYWTELYVFEKVRQATSYSHLEATLTELKLEPRPLSRSGWESLLVGFFGPEAQTGRLPDLIWEKTCVRMKDRVLRTVSLTELPQLTWSGCLQPVFEYPGEFTLSIRLAVPDRTRIRRQLETKRRVSHALSITSSLEVRNIESNSVLHSSEETLERILVRKETLFDVSIAALITGSEEETLATAQEFERVASAIGNAGLFREGVGSLPVMQSHLPGNRMLAIRKLPILSENLAHLLPVHHDYSRENDESHLQLRSRSGEVSNLNLYSRENLNHNAFICGASGSGKSFLMNAILASLLKDEPGTRLCIFDVGGSYRRIVDATGGKSISLSHGEAMALVASFLKLFPVGSQGFYRELVAILCGSGSHLTHSHVVAIDDLLKGIEGETLDISKLRKSASARSERFYYDIAHWLKPHTGIDGIPCRIDLIELIKAPISAFDFKELDSDPVLQKATILLLTELLWRDLVDGRYSRTLIVFDEVWRFFAQSRGFLEEMYRTLRKYRAGIVSITQNLADYGDEAFAKMIFTNSFTKIFLQNGASSEYLKETFDLPDTDIERALSVSSKKPHYSEFFALTPTMSQVLRLYPTREFYELANTENIAMHSRGVPS